MQCLLFIFMLLSGFIPHVLSISRKYYLIQQTKTWNDAQTYCRTNHIDLATISTSDELVKLLNEALRYQFTSSAWIGMYLNVTSWHWSYKNETPLFTNWMLTTVPPQPDNNNGKEECGCMNPGPATWYDADCTSAVPFVCFDETFSGADRYVYYLNSWMSWHDAQSFCRQMHTDMAIIRNAADNSAVQTKISDWRWGTWIGLFRDSWKWSDQTSGFAVNWIPGQPDNKLLHENCGFILNGSVADSLCSALLPFFCYREITGHTFKLRVKVQLNQDANNPIVMNAILEKIKQKLTELGVAGTTGVKWTAQPDGFVFHKINDLNV